MISSKTKALLKRRKQATERVVAWQLAQAMKKRKISKARMATLLKTSRMQVDRLLDPKNDITLSCLQRTAATGGAPGDDRTGVDNGRGVGENRWLTAAASRFAEMIVIAPSCSMMMT